MRFIQMWWYAPLMLMAVVRLCPGQVAPSAVPSTPPAALPQAPLPAPQAPPDKKDTLRALLQTLDGIRTAMDEQRKKSKTVAGGPAVQEVNEQIALLDKRRQEVERDFTVLVTGQSNQASATPTQKAAPISIQNEMSQLLTPVFVDLRALTEKSRAFQELEEELIHLRESEDQEKRAIAEIDKLLAEVKASKSPDTTLRSALNDTRKACQGRLDEVRSRSAASQHQLAELKITGASFWKDLGLQLKRFVFIRGTNILLALFVFMVVFFGLRTAYSYFMKVIALRKYQRLSFMLRVLDVAHEGGSFLLALLAALLVLYARGDWLLGGLSLLALGGLLMTAKAGITRHLEQLQFLLNLGHVREGERVIIGGVAWRVGTIYMFTQLTNPAMPGAVLRLPLQTLAGMTSRPGKLGDPWFPCEIGSWILLTGNTLAQVKNITPENVVISYQGGLERWIPMAAFLTMDTASLSGGFSRSVTVELPTSHDSLETGTFTDQLTKDIRVSLLRLMRPEELRDLKVVFVENKSSSKIYEVTGHFAGTQGPHYMSLPAMLRQATLDSLSAGQ